MSFDVAAEAYDRFMGRYSALLSRQMADLASVTHGQRALDVGCGPGALTTELVGRVGATHVAAVDPSDPFVEAAQARHPGVDVRKASAESLPFPDGAFDAALAQLVVHFMSDPVAGLSEMARVTRSGGVIAACVWDHGGAQGPLSLFWSAAREMDPTVVDESELAGAREGHLGSLLEAANLGGIDSTVLVADLEMPTFDAWWEPFMHGVGPAGSYVGHLEPDAQMGLRERCRALIPGEPFTVRARAWAARGVVQ